MLGVMKGSIFMDVIVGKEYQIVNAERSGNKNNTLCFEGKLIQETDYFYVFRGKNYCKSFLKVDFATRNYKLKDVTENKIIKVDYANFYRKPRDEEIILRNKALGGDYF